MNVGLDWNPESMETLRGRYSSALERVYDTKLIEQGESDRPGEHREHVFDFEDGLRLIISRECRDGKRYLHVSGSVKTTKDVCGKTLLQAMMARMLLLNGKSFSGVATAFMSDGGVMHLLFPLEPEWMEKIPRPKDPRMN
jgi:hypothetical protein